MKPVKPVNIKSKSPKGKSPKPVVSCTHEGTHEGWHKFHFYFATIEACNRLALALASLLRSKWPKVYFARYTNALESRLDIYVWFPPGSDYVLSQADLDRIMAANKGTRWTKVEGPIKCEGSESHAAGFDFVMKFIGHAIDLKLDGARTTALWNDALHWMHNMCGYDYVDEARCHLNALSTVIQIFDDSIKLGNKMVKVARSVRRQRNPSRN